MIKSIQGIKYCVFNALNPQKKSLNYFILI